MLHEDNERTNVLTFPLKFKMIQVVAKQALPYVRCVGDSWPLTLERASFEYLALTAQRGLCPDRVPEVFHFNKEKALIGED